MHYIEKKYKSTNIMRTTAVVCCLISLVLLTQSIQKATTATTTKTSMTEEEVSTASPSPEQLEKESKKSKMVFIVEQTKLKDEQGEGDSTGDDDATKQASTPNLILKTNTLSSSSTTTATKTTPTTSKATLKSDDDEYELDPQTVRDYELGMSHLNATNHDERDYRVAYYYLNRAATAVNENGQSQSHPLAREEIAIARIFGSHGVPRNLSKARDELSNAAKPPRASARAQFYLGFLYATGLGVRANQAKAITYWTFASLGEDGDTLAQMAMGYRHMSAINVPGTQCEISLSFYRKVASRVAARIRTSSVGAMIHRVRLFDEDEKNNGGEKTSGSSSSSSSSSSGQVMLDDDLVQYYQLLADRGDVQAQYGLGLLHYQGARGLSVQHDKALHYFGKAAEAGNNYAQAYMGKLYLEGDGKSIKQDNLTAIRYFKMAAEKNNPIGQSGLGIVYLYGSGVERDYTKAFKYFQLAADQNNVEGHFLLGIMHFHGYGTNKDFKLAVKHFNLASQLGHVLGYFNLAQMHATGTGVIKSCVTANELYKNVAERGSVSHFFMEAYQSFRVGDYDTALVKYMFLAELGYEVAQSNVAYILDQYPTSVLGSESDSFKRALVNWNRAASQGYHVARIKLGDYYYYGKGISVDYHQAALHYKYASEVSHNPQAMFNLAYMHENGLGLRKDMHLAKRFYDLASETSAEAHVPVALALLKLNVLFYLDSIFKHNAQLNSYFSYSSSSSSSAGRGSETVSSSGSDSDSDSSSNKSILLSIFLNPVEYFGQSWDLYLMSLLAALITFTYLLRRRL